MGVKRPIVDLLILAEDLRSANLLRRYAMHFIDHRRIRIEFTPSGSGESFVRTRYAEEVKTLRRAMKSSALMVHVDADKGSVANRLQQLAEALRVIKEEPRAESEPIAIVVPKRHTEAWIHGLNGIAVDEEYDYKRDKDHRVAASPEARENVIAPRIASAAKALYMMTRNNPSSVPPPTLPSLHAAIPELQRLER